MKSKKEILEILLRINSLPLEDVKAEIDSLHMKFSDWYTLTNEIVEQNENRHYSDEEKSILDDEVDISYSEYLNIRIIDDYYCDRARRDREKRDRYRQEEDFDGITDEELHILSEDDLQVIENIKKQWDDIRAKYNPVKEIRRVCKDTKDIVLFERGPFCAERLAENLKQFEKCVSNIDTTHVKNETTVALESEMSTALEYCLNFLQSVYETKMEMHDISFDEFITKLGLNKSKVDESFKEELDFCNRSYHSDPHLIQYACKLDENGKIQIIDEDWAKDAIMTYSVYRKNLKRDKIDILDKTIEYEQIVNSLPNRSTNSILHSDTMEKEEDLSSLSVEELIDRFNSNNQAIANNEQVIKQALIQRILEQQQQITEQQAEIDRLKGQKEL